MTKIIWTLALALMTTFALANESQNTRARIRHVYTKIDQIVIVRTALGVATIVQVPDRPNSIVVGDQAAYKVEYLDQALTIKPLQGGVRSNLYIYTDYRRFNVQLINGTEKEADYVVYLDNPPELKNKLGAEAIPYEIHWMPLGKAMINDSLSLKIIRAGQTEDHRLLLIEIVLHSAKHEIVKPDWIWITQNGKAKPIHNLFLAGLEVSPTSTVTGLIQILRSDLNDKIPFDVQIRKKYITSLTLPKVYLW